MPLMYTDVEPFGPASGESWRKFVDWSGLTQLCEVVMLDGTLCPSVLGDLTDENWEHNVQEDFQIGLFLDLDHVLSKLGGVDKTDVLALMRNPTAADIETFDEPGSSSVASTSWGCRRGLAPW